MGISFKLSWVKRDPFWWVGIIGNIASIIALGLSVNNPQGQLFYLTIAFLVLALSALGANAFLAYNYGREKDKFENRNEEILSKLEECEKLVEEKTRLIKENDENIDSVSHFLHAASHITRDHISLLMDFVDEGNDNIEEIKGFFRKFISDYLENVRETYKCITRDKCAACIKWICVKNENEASVSTLARDGTSKTKREDIDFKYKGYPIAENTAFERILNRDCRVFTMHDLKEEYKKGNYKNYNRNFSEFYNATIVAPIRRKTDILDRNIPSDSMTSDDPYETIAFLCVDNANGKFDSSFSKEICSLLADMLYYPILFFEEVKAWCGDNN